MPRNKQQQSTKQAQPKAKQQAQQPKAKAPKQQAQQPKAKAPKGALSPSAAVRLWNGDAVTRSMIVAESNGMSILATELQLKKAERRVQVATRRRAEVREGRIHPLDNPVVLGTGEFGFDQALTRDEAKTRVEKWLKKAKSLAALARQGDTESAEKAKSLREKARVLARAYGLKVGKDGAVAVKSETETAK